LKKIAKKIITAALAAATLLQCSAFAADLSEWAVSDYQAANEAGLISYSIVSNNLKDNITRQEFCELAVNLYKKLTNETMFEPETSPFSDTDNMAVAQAYCYGIVSGTSDSTFSPERLVTREEMAKMLVSTLTASEVSMELSDGSDTAVIDQYNDGASVSDWAKAPMITMLNYSLINGITDTSLAPLGNATREQAIASVNRSYSSFSSKSDVALVLPKITVPTEGEDVVTDDFAVSWTPVEGAQEYHIIIKDVDANPVVLSDTDNATTSVNIDPSLLIKGKQYSVIVGASLMDGSEIFSLPVDFTYSGSKASSNTYVASNPKAQAMIDEAAKYLGVKYVYGGSSPSGFDCSGLMQYVCKQVGIDLNRTSRDQFAKDGVSVSKEDLQPGDLVFFGSGGTVNHVGMYVGDGQMIHSPQTGKTVCYTSINSSYYTSRYMGAKRVY
jgi:cell wall-associated NlpC family hydrolase